MLTRYRVRSFGGVKRLSRPWEGMAERSKIMDFGWRCTNGKEFGIRPRLRQDALTALDEKCLMHVKTEPHVAKHVNAQ